jgi:hypothetical protein
MVGVGVREVVVATAADVIGVGAVVVGTGISEVEMGEVAEDVEDGRLDESVASSAHPVNSDTRMTISTRVESALRVVIVLNYSTKSQKRECDSNSTEGRSAIIRISFALMAQAGTKPR